MIGAGTIINPIIKIVTTVVILGAVYLFFVKPALDTTKDISESVTGAFPNTSEILEGVPDQGNIQEQIRQSLNQSGNAHSDKLIECVRNADQNVEKLQRCTNRFGQ